jgi:hypothetical protein
LEVGVQQVFKGGNYSREETIILLLTNESCLPLQKLYVLNEKLFEFEIQAKKDVKIQAKKNFKIHEKKDAKIQAKKDAKSKQRRILKSKQTIQV